MGGSKKIEKSEKDTGNDHTIIQTPGKSEGKIIVMILNQQIIPNEGV